MADATFTQTTAVLETGGLPHSEAVLLEVTLHGEIAAARAGFGALMPTRWRQHQHIIDVQKSVYCLQTRSS